jgi:2-C-methyl-D-erythritol 2,4-cyclodiphosphate synthase
MKIRVGFGFDVHQMTEGRELWLGGVRLDHPKGALGHSDADVLLHAISDALLGAAGLGDIGQHFPDTDPQWRGADSSRFVTAVVGMLAARGLVVGNADMTLLAQAPRIGAHREAICMHVAALLGVERDCVNLKATTTEYLGFIGRSEGLGALATVLLIPA